MLIEWQEAWLTGDDRIDAEHLELVARINALHAAVDGGGDREAITAGLRAIVERTREHFAYEESLMAATGYPDAAVHRERHGMLFGIVNLLAESIELVDGEIVLGTIGFFEDWFIGHVECDDADLGDFLAARSSDAAAAISSEPTIPGLAPAPALPAGDR